MDACSPYLCLRNRWNLVSGGCLWGPSQGLLRATTQGFGMPFTNSDEPPVSLPCVRGELDPRLRKERLVKLGIHRHLIDDYFLHENGSMLKENRKTFFALSQTQGRNPAVNCRRAEPDRLHNCLGPTGGGPPVESAFKRSIRCGAIAHRDSGRTPIASSHCRFLRGFRPIAAVGVASPDDVPGPFSLTSFCFFWGKLCKLSR